jgi:thioredoxin
MDVTTESFERDVLERSHELPVVVDLWAAWCGPCRSRLGPVLERETQARSGELELVKVDVDSNPALARSFEIRRIPAVKAFRDGQVVAEFVGALPPTEITKFLEQLTASPRSEQPAVELGAKGRP